MNRAVFRCDASPELGAGHVTRCLALAEALADTGWRISFVVGGNTLATVPALKTSGFEVRVLNEVDDDLEVLTQQAAGRAELLVVDHYGLDAQFETACRSFATKILVLDDSTGRTHDCDVLIDAASSHPAIYAAHIPAHARVLTGLAYAFVRKSFLAHRAKALARRDGRPVSEILVSCGATDPNNATSVVLDALDDIAENIGISVILSSRAPYADAIRKRMKRRVRLVVDADDIAALMSKADIAIGAAGATAYERAVLGLPSIIIIVADNQRGIAQLMTEAGASFNAGSLSGGVSARLQPLVRSLIEQDDIRVSMARAASTLVDGRGALRVAFELSEVATDRNGAAVRLRLAEASDELWLLDLQRQPRMRQHFRNSEIPSADEHHRWMERTLADFNRLFLIVERDGNRVGTLRLDPATNGEHVNRFEIAIAISSECQRCGVASAALALVRCLKPQAEFDAVVFEGNLASHGLFLRTGFIPVAGELYRSYPRQQTAEIFVSDEG